MEQQRWGAVAVDGASSEEQMEEQKEERSSCRKRRPLSYRGNGCGRAESK